MIAGMTFTLDFLVIILYFAVIMGIGLSQRSKSGSMEGFALGDRQIAWWAVLASILAAEISAGTFFGAPGEGYALRNYTYIQLMAGYLLARVVVSAWFIPAYYKYGVVSVYEFLEIRFGPRTRRWSSALFLVTRLLAQRHPTLGAHGAPRPWAGSCFKIQTSRPWVSFLLYAAALVFITVMTAIYTSVGGIRAVIWTDVIQIVILFAALGFALYYLLGHTGGWAASVCHGAGAIDL